MAGAFILADIRLPKTLQNYAKRWQSMVLLPVGCMGVFLYHGLTVQNRVTM
jgi:hypothetical protein